MWRLLSLRGTNPSTPLCDATVTAEPTSRPGGLPMMPTSFPYQRLESLLLLYRRTEATLHHRGRTDGGEKSSAKPLLLRLLHAGRYLCREEFDAISYWQPFCRDLFIDVFPWRPKHCTYSETVPQVPQHLLDRRSGGAETILGKVLLASASAFLTAMDWHRDADRLAPSTEKLFSRLTRGLFMNQGGVLAASCACAGLPANLGKTFFVRVKAAVLWR